MCVIIDTNSFHCVFDKSSQEHKEFEPILKWIIDGKGKIVYGGTKYIEELKQTPKYLKIVGQLNRISKVVRLSTESVDNYQNNIEKQLKHKDFDDPHLVAIAYISKCRIICSNDKRAYPFLDKKLFYPNNSPRPKIYSSYRNANLLSEKHIADVCLPCIKLDKYQKATI